MPLPHLDADGHGCRIGVHGPLIDGAPQRLRGCVNVDRICSHCTMVVGVVSWTKAAWMARQRLLRRDKATSPRKGP